MPVVIFVLCSTEPISTHTYFFPGTTNSPCVQGDLPFCTWIEHIVFSVWSGNVWLCCSLSVGKNASLALSSMTELSYTLTHTYSVYLQTPTYTQTFKLSSEECCHTSFVVHPCDTAYHPMRGLCSRAPAGRGCGRRPRSFVYRTWPQGQADHTAGPAVNTDHIQ